MSAFGCKADVNHAFCFGRLNNFATAPLHGSGDGVGRTIRDSLQWIKVHVGVFFSGARLNMARHLANQNKTIAAGDGD